MNNCDERLEDDSDELLKTRKQNISRHRYKNFPEVEPSGFWDLNYFSTREDHNNNNILENNIYKYSTYK